MQVYFSLEHFFVNGQKHQNIQQWELSFRSRAVMLFAALFFARLATEQRLFGAIDHRWISMHPSRLSIETAMPRRFEGCNYVMHRLIQIMFLVLAQNKSVLHRNV